MILSCRRGSTKSHSKSNTRDCTSSSHLMSRGIVGKRCRCYQSQRDTFPQSTPCRTNSRSKSSSQLRRASSSWTRRTTGWSLRGSSSSMSLLERNYRYPPRMNSNCSDCRRRDNNIPPSSSSTMSQICRFLPSRSHSSCRRRLSSHRNRNSMRRCYNTNRNTRRLAMNNASPSCSGSSPRNRNRNRSCYKSCRTRRRPASSRGSCNILVACLRRPRHPRLRRPPSPKLQ
jgi:hypothetical protein